MLAAMAGVIGATRVNDGGSELGPCAGAGRSRVDRPGVGALVAGLRIPPFILTLGGMSLFASLALRISKSSPVPARERFEWLGRQDVLGCRARCGSS